MHIKCDFKRNNINTCLLEQNQDKINWNSLSSNPNAIHLLEQNPDKINWNSLSSNPNAIHLLEQNPDKINWNSLSENPNAIHLLEKNVEKINFTQLVADKTYGESKSYFLLTLINKLF